MDNNKKEQLQNIKLSIQEVKDDKNENGFYGYISFKDVCFLVDEIDKLQGWVEHCNCDECGSEKIILHQGFNKIDKEEILEQIKGE